MSYKDIALAIIDRMEYARERNNVNWMNILRVAVKYAPKEEVRELFAEISEKDEEIGELWKSLHETLRD